MDTEYIRMRLPEELTALLLIAGNILGFPVFYTLTVLGYIGYTTLHTLAWYSLLLFPLSICVLMLKHLRPITPVEFGRINARNYCVYTPDGPPQVFMKYQDPSWGENDNCYIIGNRLCEIDQEWGLYSIRRLGYYKRTLPAEEYALEKI